MPNKEEIKEKLIDILADHSVTEIKNENGAIIKNALGASNYRHAASDIEINLFLAKLKKLRDTLDGAIKGKKGVPEVNGCIFLLHNQTGEKNEQSYNEEDFTLLTKLIKRGIYKRWNKKQKDRFDTVFHMLAHWKDYFLSYTNRNLHDTNDDFKEIIPAVLGKDFYKENKDKTNCVPHIIVHYLKQNNLEGFFDKDELKCGDVLEDEIIKYCTSVFAFVQLVEMATFKYEKDKTNWCNFEIAKFADWTEETGLENYKRYFFILTEAEVLPAVLHGDHESWKNKIFERIYINDLSILEKKQIKREVRKIAVEIAKTKNRILEDYYS
ncbi:MAG: hypothetical protein KAW12_29405 [Candidatus Aminicenantes bacterium]|nr:hypothetical protein [Candidatus Aminicenantes bacterium]